ncbi:MAG: PorP/SprF family type IX secretion system membrane protein [Bacteroidota bacterium]
MPHLHICFFIAMMCGSFFLQAQQLPLFTQYREYSTAINPATVGSNYLNFGQQGTIGLSYRSQWVDIANAPRTTIIHGSYFIDDLSGVNFIVGGQLMNDEIGPTAFTSLKGRLAAVISDDPEYAGISIGLNAGGLQYRINATELRARDAEDIMLAQNVAQFSADFGVGVFAYSSFGRGDDNFVYGGVSLPQVFGDFSFIDDNGRELTQQRVMHAYAQAGAIFTFWNDSFLEPSVWVKYAPNVPVNVDANIRYQFPIGLFIGAGGSTAGTAHLETGVLVGDNVGFEKNLQIGYGFDHSFSNQGAFIGGTHELNVAYYFSR